MGEITRREGLYSSLISEWRKQRDSGALEGLANKPKGRPRADRNAAEAAKLRKRNEALQAEVDTLRELAEAQGKAAALLRQMSSQSAEQRPSSS